MIAIVNVSEDAPMLGINTYEVRINRTVITTFNHDRKRDGMAQCLRDAADALDAQTAQNRIELMKTIDSIRKVGGFG